MRHCIIVKFLDSISQEEKKAMMPEIEKLFNHTKEIEGVHSVRILRNVVDRPNRYDISIEITMDPESLVQYDESVWHKKWKSEYGSKIASKAIIDLED